MRENYRQLYPSFVFVVNPLMNVVKSVTDDCEKCGRKILQINRKMTDHFL